MDPNELRYRRDLDAVVAAVRAWKRANPDKEPKLPDPDGVAVLADLRRAIQMFELNDAALALANHVVSRVDGATWLMFYGAWKFLYNDTN